MCSGGTLGSSQRRPRSEVRKRAPLYMPIRCHIRPLPCSKIDSNGVSLRLELASLRDVLDGVVSQMHMMAAAHEVELVVSPPSPELQRISCLDDHGWPVFIFDRSHIAQVISNFISNAIKFSSCGSQVSVSATLVGTTSIPASPNSCNVGSESVSFATCGCTCGPHITSDHPQGVVSHESAGPPVAAVVSQHEVRYAVERVMSEVDPNQFLDLARSSCIADQDMLSGMITPHYARVQ